MGVEQIDSTERASSCQDQREKQNEIWSAKQQQDSKQ